MKPKAAIQPVVRPEITVNSMVKTNPNDPVIQKKIKRATDLLAGVRESERATVRRSGE